MIFTIVSPRLILVGGGAVAQVADILAKLGVRRPFLVTDAFMVSSGLVRRVLDRLEAAGITVSIFSGTIPDPTDTVIDAGVAALRAAPEADCIIGFGGGSPIDTAKAIAILAAGGGRMGDWKIPASPDMPTLPIIAIPTTAGTGSEVTRFTIVTDTERDEKMLIAGLAALPTAAIVDHELTWGLPPRTTADTGIDSLTHALEAYVSKRANPYSDTMATRAMALIARNVRSAYAEPTNATAREAMMLGATLAGLAFSNASVALVHGMSRPIGAHFHVAHGLSNAMLLPAVTHFSLAAALPRYAQAARAMGIADDNEGDQSAAARLVEELRALNRDLAVPTPTAYGIDPATWTAKLPLMAEQALASGSPANNPRVPTAGEIIALYKEAWAG